MKVQEPPVAIPEPELHLLSEWHDEDAGRRTAWAATGSAIAHVFFFIGGVAIAAYMPPPKPVPDRSTRVDIRKSIPLVAPPRQQVTQKAPNVSQVAKELRLENLIAKPEVKAAPRVSSRPPAAPSGQAVPPPPVLEPAEVQVAQAPPPGLGIPNAALPPPVKPPQIQPDEQPKIAFERPGVAGMRNQGSGRIEAPTTSVEEAVRSARSSGGGGVAVGDVGVELNGGIGQMLGQPGSSGRQASSLELMSDPMGVDFKPYLVRVLTAVRRNWMAVVPESARLGRRGKVVVQFSISRTGSVPKLVIAAPSGTEALDRAAVAGISASNPFPPLPAEFRGDQIRLQLAFFYNVPSR
jgi:TonB family protein